MPNGFTTSKTRKARNRPRTQGRVRGCPAQAISIPATSSMTIACGSFVPSRASSRLAAQTPITVTTAVTPSSTTSPGRNHQTASATGRLVTLPGARGAYPIPPTVEIQRASCDARPADEGRRSATGEGPHQVVAVDLHDLHGDAPTGRKRPIRKVHDAVDLRGLGPGPTLPAEGRVLARAVNQHLVDRAQEPGLALPGEAVLRLL